MARLLQSLFGLTLMECGILVFIWAVRSAEGVATFSPVLMLAASIGLMAAADGLGVLCRAQGGDGLNRVLRTIWFLATLVILLACGGIVPVSVVLNPWFLAPVGVAAVLALVGAGEPLAPDDDDEGGRHDAL